jgi:hypothetical protein
VYKVEDKLHQGRGGGYANKEWLNTTALDGQYYNLGTKTRKLAQMFHPKPV